MRYLIKIFLAASAALILILGIGVVAKAQTPDTTPPSVPGGLTATAHQPSTIGLSWGASTDDVGVAGYNLYRNGVLIAEVPGTSYFDTGLGPGGYTYNVAAYDAALNVSLQSPAATAFLVSDNVPPSKPGNLSVVPASTSTVSAVQVSISWGASTDDTAVVGYYLYRNNVLLTTSTIFNATSYTDTVTPGTYQYAVSAYDTANLFSDQTIAPSITIVADSLPPSAPASLSAVIVSASQAKLSWSVAYDNIGVVGYYVYRDGTQIANVNTNSYTDSGLTLGTYTYAVAAYDGAGNVSPSTYTNITLTTNSIPLDIPSGVATALTPNGVNLSWVAPINNTFLAGYYVYRNGVQIANVTSTSYTSYLDNGIASGTWTYTVAAYNSSGNVSSQSLAANIAFNSLPPATPITNPGNTTNVASPLASGGASPGALVSTPGLFMAAMHLGSRNNQVKILQLFLIQNNYLQGLATGYYGVLTQKAIRRFQCDHDIVCSGSAGTTGWGSVGAKTRVALNNLYGNNPSSNAQNQSLQAQLLNLQAQLQALQNQVKH